MTFRRDSENSTTGISSLSHKFPKLSKDKSSRSLRDIVKNSKCKRKSKAKRALRRINLIYNKESGTFKEKKPSVNRSRRLSDYLNKEKNSFTSTRNKKKTNIMKYTGD